ncbi:hypotheical protein [Mycobacterium phage PP]|uniref:Hypotheical protein n=1 Tax=Mycobacterium phage PP TaxID=2077134 RepID=A0A2Z5XVJ8_9CAUD|nr:hypothetical protein KIW36_gp40 [Mycobacterium phage PP]BBC53851.1 hypotheical protein [Mycobacterium phage PP]
MVATGKDEVKPEDDDQLPLFDLKLLDPNIIHDYVHEGDDE